MCKIECKETVKYITNIAITNKFAKYRNTIEYIVS